MNTLGIRVSSTLVLFLAISCNYPPLTSSRRLPPPAPGAGISTAAVGSEASGSSKTSAVLDLTSKWHFALEPEGQEWNAYETDFDDDSWQEVQVPHSWKEPIESPLFNGRCRGDEGFCRGVGWYRLPLPPILGSKRATHYLDFEGASSSARVYLNGKLLQTHDGPFTRFVVELPADLLSEDKPNILAVRVSNLRNQRVAPRYTGYALLGGLYGRVQLRKTESVHFSPWREAEFEQDGKAQTLSVAYPGALVHQTTVNETEARIRVSTGIRNTLPVTESALLHFEILRSGRTIAESMRRVALSPNSTQLASVPFSLPRPRLWKAESDPFLHQLRITLSTSRGVATELVEAFGLRSLDGRARGGFFLNGERTSLRGTILFNDDEQSGWAQPLGRKKADLDLVRNLGANAIRYRQFGSDPRVHHYASQKGLLSILDLPLQNRVGCQEEEDDCLNKFASEGDPSDLAARRRVRWLRWREEVYPAYAANIKAQLAEMILQNFNQASVVGWGLFTEPFLHPSPIELTRELAQELHHLAKRLDPSRLTMVHSIGSCRPGDSGDKRVGLVLGCDDTLFKNIDLLGYTAFAGGNRDGGLTLDSFDDWLAKMGKAHPDRGFSIAAYGARGSTGSEQGEPWQTYFHQYYWPRIEADPRIWGAFVFSMFESRSPSAGDAEDPELKETGLVSYDRTVLKDAYYYYQASWQNRMKLVRIAGRNSAGPRGREARVKVFSNLATVRLLIEGRDQGEPKRPAPHVFVWDPVRALPGSRLEAIGAEGRELARDEWVVTP